jgi:hypothetical protein
VTEIILTLLLASTHIGLWSYTTNHADIAFAPIDAVRL